MRTDPRHDRPAADSETLRTPSTARDLPAPDGERRSADPATPRRATAGPGRPDRWATEASETSEVSRTAPTDDQRIEPRHAPLTFDPFCTRRLRNCTDEANAVVPGDY